MGKHIYGAISEDEISTVATGQRNILISTSNPSNSTGLNGDVYLVYTP